MATKIARGQATIIAQEDQYTITLSIGQYVFASDQDGKVVSAVSVAPTIQVIQGKDTPITSFTIGSVTSPTGMTATVDNTAKKVTFSVAAGNTTLADNGSVLIPVIVNGTTYNQSFSWSKTKAGKDSYTVLSSRQGYVIATDPNGSIESSVSTSTVITALKGATAVTPTIGTLPTVAGCSLSKTGTTVNITFNTGSGLANNGTIDIPVTVDGKSFTVTFAYSKAKRGATGAAGVDANLLDWVQNWNSNKTTIGADSVVTPKIFSGSKNADGTLTGIAIGQISVGTKNDAGAISTENLNGIFGFNNGYKTFGIDSTGAVLMGRGREYLKYNPTTGKIEFGPDVSLNWTNAISTAKSDAISAAASDAQTKADAAKAAAISTAAADAKAKADAVQTNLDNLQVGSRNLITLSAYSKTYAGFKYTNGRRLVSGTLNRINFSGESSYTSNLAKCIAGSYSVSFWFKVENYISGSTVNVNIADCYISSLNIGENKGWTFFSATNYVSRETFGFVDFEGDWTADVTLSDIVICRGSNPSANWYPAPEDVDIAIASAKAAGEAAQTSANAANTSVSNLSTYVDGAFKDGIVNTSEAQAIDKLNKQINTDYDAAINDYNIVYASTYLTGTAKSDLSTAKSGLTAAKDALQSSINTAIADGKTTSAEKSDVDAKFASYATKFKDYQTKLSAANKAIQQYLDTLSTEKVNNLQIGGRNYVIGSDVFSTASIKTLAFSSIKSWRGKRITVSVDIDVVNATGTRIGFEPSIYFTDGTQQFFSCWEYIGGTAVTRKKRISFSYTVQDKEVDRIGQNGIYVQCSGDVAVVSRPKLEIGDKPTDWSPAPEDVDANISSAKTDAINTASSDATSKANSAKDTAISTAATDATTKANAAKDSAVASAALDATNKVNAIQVGGRNYYRKSLLTDLAMSGTVVQDPAYKSVVIPVKPNEVYSISRVSATNNRFRCSFTTNPPASGVPFFGGTGSVSTYDSSLKIENISVPANANYLLVYLTNQNDPIPDIKIEKGTKATDWTPAPEDIEEKIVNKAGHAVRYIRDYLNGSTSNTGNHWVEVQAIKSGANIALNKSVTCSSSGSNLSRITDGNTDSALWASASSQQSYITVDLGEIYTDLDYIQVWHYYADGRTYHNTKTEVSADGVNWTVLFDSAIEGEYKETADGKIHNVSYARIAQDAKDVGKAAQSTIDALNQKAATESWSTKLTYIGSTGIFTGTLSANLVQSLRLDASQINAGTIDAARINVESIKTSILTAGNINALTLDTVRGKIGGWSIDSDSIYRGTKNNTTGAFTGASTYMTIGSNGIRGNKWRLDASGAGAIAGGNISWDSAGTVTFTDAVKLNWTNAIDTAKSNTISEVKNYVSSRGENLISNGTGLMGDNTNFSGFTFNGSDSYFSKGAFVDSGYNTTKFSDEIIPVDVSKKYRLTCWAKTNPYVGARFYVGITEYDCDGHNITSSNHMYIANTLTTLAQELKVGDTKVYLTSAANWINSAGTSTHRRSFIFWGYKNSFGYEYPVETYSRLLPGYNMWDDGAIDFVNNVITLRNPWSYKNPNTPDGSWPVGYKLSNGSAGGTYKYVAAGNAQIPNTWTMYSGTIGDIDNTGDNYSTKFSHGTAGIKLLFLNNRDVQGSTVWYSNLSFSVDAATKDEVNTAQSTADGVKTALGGNSYPKLTKIDATGIYTGTVTASQITAGTISADRIGAGSITSTHINTASVQAAVVTAAAVNGLDCTFVKGKIGGWTIGSSAIYNGAAGGRWVILNSSDSDSPAGSNRAHKGLTVFVDDGACTTGQVKVVQMGALGAANTTTSWTSETDYGFRILVKDVGDVFRADSSGAKIANWSFDSDSIYRGTKNNTLNGYTSASGSMTIGSNGIRGFKWHFDSDGSGAIAGGNISWDASGNVTFASSVSLSWTNAISTAKSEAISAAASDATTKASNAQTAAINAAASDASTKATAAKNDAISDAQTKVSAAKTEVIGANKWMVEMYLGTTTAMGGTMESIKGKTPSKILEIADTALSAGMDLGSTYIGHATCYVYLDADYTHSTTITTDDSGSVYLNGAKLINTASCQATAVSLAFKAGWNKVEIIWNENTGGDGGNFASKLSTLTQVKRMQAYPVSDMNSRILTVESDVVSAAIAASSAQTTASTAVTNAATADGKAVSAQNTANTANTTANSAVTALGGSGFPKLTKIDSTGIYTGTLTADQINVTGIDASKITVGSLSADRIAAGSLNGNKITAGTISADRIVAGSITSTQINTSSIQSAVVTAGAVNGLTCAFTKGSVGGWTIDSDSIYRGTKNNTLNGYTSASGGMTIGSNGIRGFKWHFDSDGSGAVAGGNISWDASGNVTFGESVSLNWNSAASSALSSAKSYADTKKTEAINAASSDATEKVNNLQIGGRNYFISSSRSVHVYSGLSYTADAAWCPYGFYAIGTQDQLGWLRISNVIKSNGYWTVSFEMRGSQNCPVSVSVDICDTGLTRISSTSDNTWKKFTITANVTNYGDGSVFNFVDFSAFDWAYFYVRNIKIEQGNKVTDWSPAPEDVDAATAAAKSTADSAVTALGGSGFPKLTKIDSSGIYTGTLTANQVNVSGINAGNITTGTMHADRIQAGTITSTHISTASIQAAVVTAAAVNGLTCSFTKGTIGGWSIASNQISGGSTIISSTGSITNGNLWKLNSDGSGQLANGNISWTAAGALTLTGKVTSTSGSIGGWTISSNTLTAQSGSSIYVEHNGSRFLRINGDPNSALLSLRADGGTGISLYTQDSQGVGMRVMAQTYGTAIESYGSVKFYQRYGETWCMPGVLVAGVFQGTTSGISVTYRWGEGMTITSISRINVGIYRFYHNLNSTEYTVIVTPASWSYDGKCNKVVCTIDAYTSSYFDIKCMDFNAGNKDIRMYLAVIGRPYQP